MYSFHVISNLKSARVDNVVWRNLGVKWSSVFTLIK